jgi:predicted nucleic acid binding AN1-type Zn finger protein
MDKMIAYCGLTCTDCPAYLATQADDRQALERVAAQWREQFNEPRITADAVICDGCLGGGRLSGYCSMCQIRVCAVERGVANCAHCADYACDKLDAFFQHAPEARAFLDQLAGGLT